MWGIFVMWDASIILCQYCASSPDNSLSDKSFLMISNHLRFGLPLLLFPGTSIHITLLPTYSYSLLKTCPYHFNLLSCTFLDISPTFVVPLIMSFLILSSLVTPLIHLNIFISLSISFVYISLSISPIFSFTYLSFSPSETLRRVRVISTDVMLIFRLVALLLVWYCLIIDHHL